MTDTNRSTDERLQQSLVYRLRSAGKRMPESEIDGGALMNEAADEIERLQAMYLSAVRGRAEFRKLVQEMRKDERTKETVSSEDVLCVCGHDYAQHSKGAVRRDYCRHCICEKWQRADSAPRRANRCEHPHSHEDRNGNPICSDCGEEL